MRMPLVVAGGLVALLAVRAEEPIGKRPVAAGLQRSKTMVDRECLAKLVETLKPDYARMIRANDTKITAYETPFFERGNVFEVLYHRRSGPTVFTVGTAEPDSVVLLPDNPKGFVTLAAQAGLSLDTPEKRNSYVLTFLQTTRSFAKRFQIVGQFREIQRLPNPTPDQAQRLPALTEKYEPVIHPLKLSGQAPWQGELFAIKGQDLVRLDVVLLPDGRVEVKMTLLEPDFPTTAAL